MNHSFESQVALVTGAGSGIGLATARAFAQAGAAVALIDMDENAVGSAVQQLLVIAINLRGVWNCMKYELRHMRERGSGVVVSCSSTSGLIGTPGLGAYTASKHGVIGLTKSAALEYAARGIRVNAVCPGAIDTPMVANALANEPETMKAVMKEIPLGRLGRSEEIASAVLWLCSPGAGFIVGQVVVPDGGYTTR